MSKGVNMPRFPTAIPASSCNHPAAAVVEAQQAAHLAEGLAEARLLGCTGDRNVRIGVL